jgi:hypothetical protein
MANMPVPMDINNNDSLPLATPPAAAALTRAPRAPSRYTPRSTLRNPRARCALFAARIGDNLRADSYETATELHDAGHLDDRRHKFSCACGYHSCARALPYTNLRHAVPTVSSEDLSFCIDCTALMYTDEGLRELIIYPDTAETFQLYCNRYKHYRPELPLPLDPPQRLVDYRNALLAGATYTGRSPIVWRSPPTSPRPS